jgi:Raf kinase inhibitor-like YbhB/YbcL family protein
MADTAFTLASPSFKHNDTIPVEFTHQGFAPGARNESPALVWGNAPKHTKSFVLICEDPDAVGKTFVHWVVYDIPASVHELPSELPYETPYVVSQIGTPGKNDYGALGYGGPRPPVGTGVHRYVFTLYALDEILGLPAGLTANDVRREMQGHVLAAAQLIGRVAAPAARAP